MYPRQAGDTRVRDCNVGTVTKASFCVRSKYTEYGESL